MKSLVLLIIISIPLSFFFGCGARTENSLKPNFIIILTDDQGYGDLGCFGGSHVNTPNIDEMASEGIKLTSFYVAAPVCSPSRAALMTGSYPKRIDMAYGSNFGVLLAEDTKGLNPSEITIAEVLKDAGYATGMFGKWHLGDQKEFLPTRQGFDEFFGLPYSWDIDSFHPNPKYNFPPLPLLEGEKVIEIETGHNVDLLTQRITKRAVGFIKKHKSEPFFLYLPHFLPHKPIRVSPDFMKSVPDSIQNILDKENGYVDYKTRDLIYPQGIDEIDWSVGQILDALKKLGIDNNTLVVFTSDNGPARGGLGSASPLRGRKGSTFEGGMREPAIVRWPGKIPRGLVSDEIVTSMDLYPTLTNLAKGKLPTDRVIDGKDIWPVLTGKGKSPHKAFFYYQGNDLKAVRSGKWKLHVKDVQPTFLYDLESDIGEKINVLDQNPEVAQRLLKYIEDFKSGLETNSRPAGFVDAPKPLTR